LRQLGVGPEKDGRRKLKAAADGSVNDGFGATTVAHDVGDGGQFNGRKRGDAPGGMVSVEHLKVPESAMKEMRKFFKDFDAGKLDDSVKHASKAIELYPQWSVAHHNLGQTYARMGDYDRAIAEFQTAAELDTRQARSWLGLSKIYFLQKRFPEGETAARRALEIEPVNSDASIFWRETW
jgi:tetratricopeptide (TPR) repeat protein